MDGSFAADKRRARPRLFFPKRNGLLGPDSHVWGQKIIIKKKGAQVRARCQTPSSRPPGRCCPPRRRRARRPRLPDGAGVLAPTAGPGGSGGAEMGSWGLGEPRETPPGTGRWSRRQPRGSRARVGSAEGLERRKAGDGEEER